MNPHIQFRIHKQYTDVSGFLLSYIPPRCTQGFVFQHPEDEEVNRTHIHSYMFTPTITRKSCSEQIAKKLGLKGNEDFATTDYCGKDKRPLDLSGAWSYGSKFGTIAPIYLHNIPPATVKHLNEYAKSMAPKANATVVKEHIVIVKQPKHKDTQHDTANQFIDYFLKKHDTDIVEWQGRFTIDQVACEVIDFLKGKSIWCGMYKTHDYIENILTKMNSVEYKKLVLASWTKKIYRGSIT